MRRTEQEFKAELTRRCENYRRAQAKKRKQLLGAGLCACLCYVVLMTVAPWSGAGSDYTAQADMAKPEAAMAQEPAWMPESDSGAGVPMENAADGKLQDMAEPTPDISVSSISSANSWPLREEDALLVSAFLNRTAWVDDVTNCIMDCKLLVNGAVYEYSTACGVFCDVVNCRSLPLEEADRQTVNAMLEAYLSAE